MRLLLTNDDGISSPGLRLLADKFRAIGHSVLIVAPASDQSGVSHSVTFLSKPCKLAEIDSNTWSCEGTPVDCVILALKGRFHEFCRTEKDSAPPFDVIISGINCGANLGTDIVYSGTAAAARQGALNGIPSLALSLAGSEPWNWEAAVSFSAENLEKMLAYWKPGVFINVNIPNIGKKQLTLLHAFPSLRYYNDSVEIFHAPDNFRYCFTQSRQSKAKPEKGSDYEAVGEQCASLSEIYIHPVLFESVVKNGGV